VQGPHHRRPLDPPRAPGDPRVLQTQAGLTPISPPCPPPGSRALPLCRWIRRKRSNPNLDYGLGELARLASSVPAGHSKSDNLAPCAPRSPPVPAQSALLATYRGQNTEFSMEEVPPPLPEFGSSAGLVIGLGPCVTPPPPEGKVRPSIPFPDARAHARRGHANSFPELTGNRPHGPPPAPASSPSPGASSPPQTAKGLHSVTVETRAPAEQERVTSHSEAETQTGVVKTRTGARAAPRPPAPVPLPRTLPDAPGASSRAPSPVNRHPSPPSGPQWASGR